MNKMKQATARFCLRIVLYVVISVVLAFGIYRWNAQTLAGNRLPMPFGRGMAVVLSGSMEPELSEGDLVFVKAAKSYEIGDVVVYQSGNSLIIHRIIAISPDGEMVLTRGDANTVADDPIDVSAIKGKMTGKIRGAGNAVSVLRSPAVVVTILALAVALMALSYRSEKKKHDEETEAVLDEIRQLKEELHGSADDGADTQGDNAPHDDLTL